MPDKFDLFRVDYIDKNESGLAFAPCYKIEEGDTVETALGRAFVVMREGYCGKDEKWIKMITGIVPISRILFKIQPMHYDEDA